MSSLNEKLANIEREIQALKTSKVRSASILRTKTTPLSLSFNCKVEDYDVWAEQAAYITATANETELAAITFGGDWDGRIYETRRLVGSATEITWVVAPTVFLISDFNRTSGFTLSRVISITSSSDAVIALSYGNNPYHGWLV